MPLLPFRRDYARFVLGDFGVQAVAGVLSIAFWFQFRLGRAQVSDLKSAPNSGRPDPQAGTAEGCATATRGCCRTICSSRAGLDWSVYTRFTSGLRLRQ